LPSEFNLHRILQGGVGIPNIKYFGTEEELNILIKDLLGGLKSVFSKCGRRFSLKTTLM